MRSPASIPSLVPSYDVTVHVVLDDFGKLGRSYREADEDAADLETVINDFLTGQYIKPQRVVAFNTAEGWARAVSEDVAWEILKRAVEVGSPLPRGTREFVVYHVGEDETLRAENAIL